MSAEGIELRKARDRLCSLSGAEWFLCCDEKTAFVEAMANGERTEIARFSRAATPDEIDFFANAPHMVALLLRLVDRAIAAALQDKSHTPERKQSKAANYAPEAAMKCGEAAFLVFLEQRHGLERLFTDEKAAQKLRSLLRITSKKELNNDSAAAERWRSLRTTYEAWRKAGQ